jgi:hypothetical protein
MQPGEGSQLAGQRALVVTPNPHTLHVNVPTNPHSGQYDPPPGPPPGWYPPHYPPYHRNFAPFLGLYSPQFGQPQQPPPPPTSSPAQGIYGQGLAIQTWFANAPGLIDLQCASLMHNPIVHSTGPAGATGTRHYDQIQHPYDVSHPSAQVPSLPYALTTVPALPSNPPMQTTAPELPSVPPIRRTAPNLPAEVLAAINNPASHQKLRNTIRITSPKDAACMAEIETQCNAIHDCENLFTHKHHRSIMVTWSIIVALKHPDLSVSEHWSTPIVLAHAKFYLRWWVSLIFASSK